jgi:hypothetical protein
VSKVLEFGSQWRPIEPISFALGILFGGKSLHQSKFVIRCGKPDESAPLCESRTKRRVFGSQVNQQVRSPQLEKPEFELLSSRVFMMFE